MKATTWTLGIIAGIVLLVFVVAAVPRLLPQVFLSLEYKYVNMAPGSSLQVGADLSQLRAQGWKLDDLLVDSCGNMTFILRKEK